MLASPTRKMAKPFRAWAPSFVIWTMTACRTFGTPQPNWRPSLSSKIAEKAYFIDVTGRSGLARPTLEMSGWSNGVADFDNDGLKDLFVARGNVLDNIAEFSTRTYAEPNSIFRNLGNMKFADVTAQAGPRCRSPSHIAERCIGDLFNDGQMDIVVTVLNGKARILRNVTANDNNWMIFQLVGTKSNRMAIGAQLKITAEDGNSQYDIVSTSAGYGASRDPRVHFGLGKIQNRETARDPLAKRRAPGSEGLTRQSHPPNCGTVALADRPPGMNLSGKRNQQFSFPTLGFLNR